MCLQVQEDVAEEDEESASDSSSSNSNSAANITAVQSYDIGSMVVCVQKQIPKEQGELALNPGDIVQGRFHSLCIILNKSAHETKLINKYKIVL